MTPTDSYLTLVAGMGLLIAMDRRWDVTVTPAEPWTVWIDALHLAASFMGAVFCVLHARHLLIGFLNITAGVVKGETLYELWQAYNRRFR